MGRVLGGLFDHFEAREAESPGAPAAFGTAPARRELRWVTATRVAAGIVVVAAALLTFFGTDLPPALVTGLLGLGAVALVVLVLRGVVALRRLAAVEHDAP